MERITWLVLGYQVPATPSKKRVYVWRKLKEMGATYFRQGVAMLPKTTANQQRFLLLSKKITDMGGDATLAELRYLDPQDDVKAVAEFRKQSQKEYQKVLSEIEQLYIEIENNPQLMSEYSDKTRRLGRKLSQIKARDYFMFRQEPEVSGHFNELLHDMSNATSQLREHITNLLSDR